VLVEPARSVGASPLGDRTALSGFQERTRTRPLRRPVVSGLATPHGPQRGGLRVSPNRTDATSRRAIAHVSAGARVRPGDFHGAAADQSPSIHAVDEPSRTAVSS